MVMGLVATRSNLSWRNHQAVSRLDHGGAPVKSRQFTLGISYAFCGPMDAVRHLDTASNQTIV